MKGPLAAAGAAAHPWLDGRFAPVATLAPRLRVWSFLAANTAAGNLRRVARDWSFLGPEAQAGGLEIILQTHLFAGYPRTINALAAVQAAGIAPGVMPGAVEQPGDWLGAGEELCQRIYGPGYEHLRARMGSLHPALDRWMVELGYGRVLSRPGPTARERELCAIAVLAGQNVRPQLVSHLRGAVRVGATPAECRAILDQTSSVWGDECQRQVDRDWLEVVDLLG